MAYLLFTGGYTQPILLGTGEVIPGRCPGIACYRLDVNGTLSLQKINPCTPNPSYLAVNSQGDRLYCANELKEWNGVTGSTVSAYKICRESGTLTFLNRQHTGGEDACFVSLAQNDRYLLAANYSGGSCAVYPILNGGLIGEASCFVQHRGKSVDPGRQEGPHVHHITETPDGMGVLAVDLGQDKILHYGADWDRGQLISNQYPAIETLPGQGPRHLAWGKNGRFLYVLTEMTGQINVYSRNSDETFRRIQTVSTAECGETETSGAAILLHPNGKYLYVSLRGTGKIGIFEIGEKGMLAPVEHISCQGKVPRDFVISPDGAFLVAANQESGNLAVFRLNAMTGKAEYLSTETAPGITTVVFA